MPPEFFLLNEAHFCRRVDYTKNVISFYAFPAHISSRKVKLKK